MKSIALMLFVLISACATAPCRQQTRPLLFMTDGQMVHVADIAEARLGCAMSPDEHFFIFEVRPHGHRLVMACVGGQVVPTDRRRAPGCFPDHCY